MLALFAALVSMESGAKHVHANGCVLIGAINPGKLWRSAALQRTKALIRSGAETDVRLCLE
eukprot:5054232-Amphidinium_carterae.1